MLHASCKPESGKNVSKTALQTPMSVWEREEALQAPEERSTCSPGTQRGGSCPAATHGQGHRADIHTGAGGEDGKAPRVNLSLRRREG